ncbi:hypothetical protein LZ554_001346 [Drepanopeziza brunnea f. sp. 'monogermtubi']|nr:hypothetical protein LZ554_001346 [Drepanopeziza brunnea f. sp. 'monogermtubi']
MLRSKSIFAILLAFSLLFSRAQGSWWRRNMVIGYTALSEEEAKRINEDNKLHVPDESSQARLGPGFYMVNEPGNWPREAGNWYCAIKARKRRIKRASKVYIPRSYEKLSREGVEQQALWFQDETVIKEYIESDALVPDSEKALRFSWVRILRKRQLQMVIPTKAVEDDQLKLWAKCFESQEKLKEFSKDVINWEGWTIRGDRGKYGQATVVDR